MWYIPFHNCPYIPTHKMLVFHVSVILDLKHIWFPLHHQCPLSPIQGNTKLFLLWRNNKAKGKEKTNIWMSVWWKTTFFFGSLSFCTRTTIQGVIWHCIVSTILCFPGLSIFHKDNCCLLWIKKARDKDKTYIWVSVWWKTKNEIWKIYTSHIHWVARGTGTPKDRDEVNRRDVCECDGWVWVLEVIGAPSILSVIRKSAVLTRVLPTFAFRVVKNDTRRKWNSPRLYSPWKTTMTSGQAVSEYLDTLGS